MGPIESEFDPTLYSAEFVTAEVGDNIQAILDRVNDALARTPNIVLILPRNAQAFHTTHDFLALGKLQGGQEVRISVASPDPTIAGLARVLGFHIVEMPPDHPYAVNDVPPGPANASSDAEKPTSPLPLGRGGEVPEWVISQSGPAYPPSALTTSTWLNNPADYTLEGNAQAHPSQPLGRPGMPPPRTKPRHPTGYLPTGGLQSIAVASPMPSEERFSPATPLVASTPSGRIKARQIPDEAAAYEAGSRPRARIGRVLRSGRLWLTVLILLAAGLGGGAYYAFTYLPEGTVAVTPLNKSITALPVKINVLTSGGSRPITGLAAPLRQSGDAVSARSLTATLIKAPITEEGTRPASGTRQVARGRAQGTMHFVNRTGNPTFVAAGTRFSAANGVAVQAAQGGTVPATIFGVTFGTLDLPITANVQGPDGNLGARQVSGVYAGALDYSNTAMEGGALDTIKVVAQADIDAAAADLKAQAQSKVGGAVLGMVTAGQQLITQTVSLVSVAVEADHKAGDDAESVRVKVTAEARAYVFNQSDIEDAVRQAVLDWVLKSEPATAGPHLDFNSINFAPPSIEAMEQGRVLYSTSANAQVSFTLTPDLARQIRDLVKGKDLKLARSLITQQYGGYVNTASIQSKVLWFSVDKLPSDPARIGVQSSAGGGTMYMPAGGDTQPGVTPDPRGPR